MQALPAHHDAAAWSMTVPLVVLSLLSLFGTDAKAALARLYSRRRQSLSGIRAKSTHA